MMLGVVLRLRDWRSRPFFPVPFWLGRGGGILNLAGGPRGRRVVTASSSPSESESESESAIDCDSGRPESSTKSGGEG